MIDTGSGPPLVLIPGIQGRWEWMAPAIDALSERHRVLSFSLDEAPYRRDISGVFDAWIDGIDAMLDRAGVSKALIVGVSFGGLIAARYAARRPARTGALVMVSSPSPRHLLDEQSEAYLRHPRLAMPLFAARACRRLLPETFAARPTWGSRARFLGSHVVRILQTPIHPSRMAHWVRAWMATDIAADCRLVSAPTLVLTGEPHLDRVVPVADSLDVVNYITHAKHVVLDRTGHIGLVSRPAEFAALVSTFAGNTAPGHPAGIDGSVRPMAG
jgi:pimeloyl-ACP methyl ester carboxylesterase